jgi:hypothetical protein
VLTVSALWISSLAIAMVAAQLWAGQAAPIRGLLNLIPGIPIAPSVFALPLVTIVIALTGDAAPVLALVTWLAVLASYWGLAGWLSWRTVSYLSLRSFLALATLLLLSAPLWLIAVAWIASF